jgi:predicted ATPase
MIHAVRFRNFKALRDVELGLDRFTVLVGPNASGKTSVLEGLHHLSRLASTDPRYVLTGAAGIGVVASRGATGVFELGLSGTFRRKPGDLSLSFDAVEDYPFSDIYRFESSWGERRFSIRRELSPPDDAPRSHPGSELGLGLVLQEAAYLRFDLERLAEASYSDLPTPVIGPDGSGLAAVVADMAVARPDDFGRLQEALRAVIPGLLRVRLARAKVARRGPAGASAEGEEPVWGHEIVFDMAGASDIPARAASEGVLVMLGLFVTLLGPDRHDLVLVDRLERALNPRLLGELIAQIDQILATDPRLQIVATSDSPALLDHLGAEAVRVHCLLEDGSVRVKPLTRHPEYARILGDLRPGELWAQVGDAGVAEEPRADAPQGAQVPTLVDGLPSPRGRSPSQVPPPLPPTEAPVWPSSMPPLPSGPSGGPPAR